MRFRILQRVLAVLIGVPAVVYLVNASHWLVMDYQDACQREIIDTGTVDALENLSRNDIAYVPVLADVRDRITTQSLSRKARQQRIAYMTIASALAFVLCGKWFVTVGRTPAPSLPHIRRHRGDMAGGRKGWNLFGKGKAHSCQCQDEPEIDLSYVDQVVAEEGTHNEAAIPILQRIQTHYRYLPNEALERVCELTEITPSQIAGVSSFYSQFRRSPVGKYIIKVCHGTACHVTGATEITEEVRRHLKIEEDSDTDPERLFTVEEVACLGCCSLAPVLMIDETTAGNLKPASACEAIEEFRMEQSE
jgi:NADH:ubiquinone oxidoreductase subunit E